MFDPECLNLAKHFLEDDKNFQTLSYPSKGSALHELAQLIQDTIEDYINFNLPGLNQCNLSNRELDPRPAGSDDAYHMVAEPRAGDHVYHKPTRETWVVRRVIGDRLQYCGWPQGQGLLADCRLVYRATEAEHRQWIEDIAKSEAQR